MCEKLTLKISTGLLILSIIQFNTIFAQPLRATATSTPGSCTKRESIITVTATGGRSPYIYSFDNQPFQNSPSWKGYGSHVYTITVQDATGYRYPFYVTANTIYPPLDFTLTPTKPTTCTVADGMVTFNPSGGTPPYSFTMDMVNFQSGNTFNNLADGLYWFGIKDANGCRNSHSQIIRATSCPYNFGYVSTHGVCNRTETIGWIRSNQFMYSLDGINYQSSPEFSGMPPGVYKYYLKDQNGTVCILGTNIYNNCELSSKTTVFNATCGNTNGRIEIMPQNGTQPYQFSIDGINFQPGNIFSGLAPGPYDIFVKDAAGFITTESISIANACLSSNSSATNATCGNSNGTITAYVLSGIPPYRYSIDGVNFQSSNIFSGVGQGNYIVTVKDANGSSSTSQASVGNIAGPQITSSSVVASCSNNDGSINIAGTGGTAPFLYSINNSSFQNNSRFIHLSTGNYTAVIKDANGCLASQPVTVDLSSSLFIDAGADVNINEGETATLTTASNGTSFSWMPSDELNNASILSPDASPRVTTQYYVTARWGICENKDSVTVIVKPVPFSDIFVPNAFTPNSDGRNDVFKARVVGIRQFKYFAVFNRWGQRVFYTTSPGTGWNGTINGKISQAGTYVWKAAGISIRGALIERRGTVELIR